MPEYSAPGRSGGFACEVGAGSDAGGFSWASAIMQPNANQPANMVAKQCFRMMDVYLAVMVLHGYGAFVSYSTVHSHADRRGPSAIIDAPLCLSDVVEWIHS